MMEIYDTLVSRRYDGKSDLLFLHKEGVDFRRAFGEEPENGIIVFKDMDTGCFVGLTIMDCCALLEKREQSLRKLGIELDLSKLCSNQIPPA